MKKTLLSIFICSFLLNTVKAQTGASATWTLLSDPTASITGNITASSQTLGPLLAGVSYNTSYGTTANNNVTTGWQRVATTSGIRMGSDSAFTQGGYVQYSVTPTAGNYLQINTVSLEVVGGGTGSARLAAVYSLNNFATMDSFGVTSSYNSLPTRATRFDSVVLINGGSSIPVLTGQQVLSFSNLAINAIPGQTFSVRFYVWLTGFSATVRHLGERNVVISGVTSPTPLPVKFANANAFQRNNGIQVEWTSATEVNVNKYAVERSSDGRTFREVGTVAAKGNSTLASSYSWYDASPVAGNNFYKIRAIDKDGHSTYTSVIKISLDKKGFDLAIAPNPVKGNNLNLQLETLARGSYSVTIFNGVGQQVLTKTLTHDGGSGTYQVQLPASMKAGMYNLQLKNGETVINKKLIVE